MKITAFITALLLSVSPVVAQEQEEPPCAPITEGLEVLKTQYNEDIRMIANRADGGVLIITVSPSGSWSAIMLEADGMSCLGAWGQGISFEAPGVDM